MSQQVEKHVAEGSAAMADEEEVVSITIPIIIIFVIYLLSSYFIENSPQYP